jgi:hypothetical protein
MSDRPLIPGGQFPHLNQRANGVVRVFIGTPRGPGDDTHVQLRVEDHTSGEVLVDVELDAAQMWLLCQGGTQVWPAFVGVHLDRVGKRMENERVNLPPEHDDDTERDVARDVWRAVHEQLPEHWHDWGGAYDEPRTDNTRTRYTIVRRWVTDS